MERSYAEAASAAYVLPQVEPAFFSHHQSTVFAAEFSPLADNRIYATDYQSYRLRNPYLAPALVPSHSNYQAPAPVAVAEPSALAAAPVEIASQGLFQSVSPASYIGNSTLAVPLSYESNI